jgi:multidrug resistance efflux pump
MTDTSELAEDQKKSVSKEVETVVRNFLKDISYKSEVAIRANVDGYVFRLMVRPGSLIILLLKNT